MTTRHTCTAKYDVLTREGTSRESAVNHTNLLALYGHLSPTKCCKMKRESVSLQISMSVYMHNAYQHLS